MKIKKGEKLLINDKRKGIYIVIAEENFDTEETEFFPVILFSTSVKGLNTTWQKGDKIPCRKSLIEFQKYYI